MPEASGCEHDSAFASYIDIHGDTPLFPFLAVTDKTTPRTSYARCKRALVIGRSDRFQTKHLYTGTLVATTLPETQSGVYHLGIVHHEHIIGRQQLRNVGKHTFLKTAIAMTHQQTACVAHSQRMTRYKPVGERIVKRFD